MTEHDAILNLEEAAACLKLSDPKKLLALATGPRPRLSSLKIGRDRVYPLAALEEFVESDRTPAVKANPWGLSEAQQRRLAKRTG